MIPRPARRPQADAMNTSRRTREAAAVGRQQYIEMTGEFARDLDDPYNDETSSGKPPVDVATKVRRSNGLTAAEDGRDGPRGVTGLPKQDRKKALELAGQMKPFNQRRNHQWHCQWSS